MIFRKVGNDSSVTSGGISISPSKSRGETSKTSIGGILSSTVVVTPVHRSDLNGKTSETLLGALKLVMIYLKISLHVRDRQCWVGGICMRGYVFNFNLSAFEWTSAKTV